MAPLRPVSITNLLQLSESEEEKYDSYEHLKSSDEDDDKDKTEQVFTSHSAKKNKPEALNGMKSVFEVCQWLITERTDILMIANQMYNAMNTSLDSSHVNMSTILMPKSATVVHENEKTLARLWHEEIKCLFIRCRAPPDVAIERLVKNIFNYDLYSNNAEEVIGHSKRVLTDFRSKVNKKIDTKVHEFKESRLRAGQRTTPTTTEIEEFMSQEVVEQLLFRYLAATDKAKLKKCGTME
ncbi:unnamed protein product [Rhizophagus irregularis]|uniref:Uncharacterized protein n=1 Tax=Rhizophagus irregularis TaxID=588596 RepID=A0A915ZVG1_9GLOM|nr:unnamed protein product [Rhizophagus irregularis]CAB5392766.1 unnamed protein product [Rhizophagus irregularis]